MGYRHFIVFDRDSVIIALGSECAADQGAFWRFHDAYYEEIDVADALFGPSPAELSSHIARELELDMERFNICMSQVNPEARDIARQASEGPIAYDRVKISHQDALAHGVNATPTLLVNGLLTQGGPQDFLDAVEQAINSAKAVKDAQ